MGWFVTVFSGWFCFFSSVLWFYSFPVRVKWVGLSRFYRCAWVCRVFFDAWGVGLCFFVARCVFCFCVCFCGSCRYDTIPYDEMRHDDI